MSCLSSISAGKWVLCATKQAQVSHHTFWDGIVFEVRHGMIIFAILAEVENVFPRQE